jgi:DNA-binding transcriptional MerR regulator
MTIGELAQQSGVSRDALRFYERKGLLARPGRSASGYRLYGESDVARLLFIRRAQAAGLTLDDIRELLRVQHLQEPEACHRVAARLKARIAAIDGRIAELAAFRQEMARGLAQCKRGARSCPVVLNFGRGVAENGRG